MEYKRDKNQRIKSKEDYDSIFEKSDYSARLKVIQDTRKFEIELYWKRATYFWTFIGGILAAYLTLFSGTTELSQYKLDQLLYLLNIMGLVFSFA